MLEAVGLVARGDLGGDGVPVAAVGGVVGGARGEVVGIQIGELETATGEEDLDPLLDALSPVLDAVG